MSGWHREHPELAGTDADPWMANPSHRAAAQEVTRLQGCPRTSDEVDGECDVCTRPAESHPAPRANDDA